MWSFEVPNILCFWKMLTCNIAGAEYVDHWNLRYPVYSILKDIKLSDTNELSHDCSFKYKK